MQAAHFLLLFIPGLVAPELVVLLVLLLALAAADALLAALIILDPLGDQRIRMVVKPGGVHLDGRGIHHPALPLALRLLGLVGLLFLGLGGLLLGSLCLGFRLGGLGLLVGFRLLGLGLLLFRLLLLGLGNGLGKDLLQRGDLVGLGHDLKDLIQLRIRQDLGVGLGLFAELADDLADLLGGHAEIGSQLL